ncbi:MAG: penicillin-binding protein [Erysipelotrichaceae bacterium]|nr:penicillin-binding protein [Erysipelotrichaceae bacterium]
MRRLVRYSLFGILTCYSLLLSVYLLAYVLPLPQLGESERIEFLDRNGDVFFESNFDKKSTWIDYEDIPSNLIDAFIAIEDRRFYQHYGLDPFRIAKSLLVNLQSGSIKQGGSTITQQYARNLFLDQSKTLTRKLYESFYAMQIEMHYNKEQIIEGYLNTLYFGHGIYGIQKASQYYFDKEPFELSFSEIALLVGVCNAPAYYSPYLHVENARSKQLQTLYTLYSQGLMSEEEYLVEREKELVVYDHSSDQVLPDHSSFYKDCVIYELSKLGFLEGNTLDHGLIVYTYYSPEVSAILNRSITAHVPSHSDIQVSGIISEPYSGEVLAIQGSTDYTKSQYNRALYSSRQIASTIKPLLYYLALESGFTPSTTFLSQPTSFRIGENEVYSPTNFDDIYAYREIPMVHALAVSDNIYAVKTHLFLGSDILYNALRSLGYDQSENIASLALGSIDMSVFELNQLYSLFASEGLYSELSFIDTITDRRGNILYQRDFEPHRLLHHDTTLIMNQMLRAPFDIHNQGYTTPSLLGFEPRVITGAKSGTSLWDSWISGFNPDYSVTIWNGYDENKKMNDSSLRRVSRLVYRDIFNMLYSKDEVGPWYVRSDGLIEVRIDPKSGLPDSEGSIYWYKR